MAHDLPLVDDWRKYLGFRCTGCGNCCRRTVVMLTDADVGRIIAGTGERAEDFVRFVSEAEAQIEQRSPFWVRFDGARGVMALRHRAGGACVFLDDDDRCTIYEHRPVTCREHPLEVELSDSGAVETIALSDIVDCPHDWDGGLRRRDLAKVVRRNERQSEPYLDRVIAWNRRRRGPKTRPAFLSFLGLSD